MRLRQQVRLGEPAEQVIVDVVDARQLEEVVHEVAGPDAYHARVVDGVRQGSRLRNTPMRTASRCTGPSVSRWASSASKISRWTGYAHVRLVCTPELAVASRACPASHG